MRFNAGCCGISGKCTGSVSGGGDSKLAQSVVLRHGDSERKTSGLECAGWVIALFFYECSGVALAMQNRSPAFAEGYGLCVREH